MLSSFSPSKLIQAPRRAASARFTESFSACACTQIKASGNTPSSCRTESCSNARDDGPVWDAITNPVLRWVLAAADINLVFIPDKFVLLTPILINPGLTVVPPIPCSHSFIHLSANWPALSSKANRGTNLLSTAP